MREFKFRAWHKNNKRMCYNVNTSLQDREYLEFMPYTGLKDKNGKEIYKGDIVKCTEVTDTMIEEYISEVFWEGCCFLVHQSDMCDCYLGMFEEHEGKYPLTEIEVIGNIYENNNLLKS